MIELFTIHASNDGNWIETQEASPTLTVAKANSLHKSGWDVHITDSDGRRYGPIRFYHSTENHQLSSRRGHDAIGGRLASRFRLVGTRAEGEEMNRWSEDEEQRLRSLAQSGLSISQIAFK